MQAKSSFEVGDKEKHLLTVDYDWLTKHIRIELDGSSLSFISPLTERLS